MNRKLPVHFYTVKMLSFWHRKHRHTICMIFITLIYIIFIYSHSEITRKMIFLHVDQMRQAQSHFYLENECTDH